MEKKYQSSLFIFRRDLRLEDNTGLLLALNSSKSVIPAFIFTPEQIEKNPYLSKHCLKFMIESLKDLEMQLEEKGAKLYLFFGNPEEIVKKIITTLSIDALFVNRDYTPYSIQRDKQLEHLCEHYKVAFHSSDDALLQAPEESVKADKKPYLVFTPYFHHASEKKISPPTPNREKNYFTKTIAFADPQLLEKMLPKIKTSLKGGRSSAIKILKKISSFQDYENVKDFPKEDATTHLSAYLKFTLCSPRETYHAIADTLTRDHPLIRSLYWRDFFTHIAFFFPHVFTGSFHQKYDKLTWSNDKDAFLMWCKGMTGFPIVDAGMRQMNETGFMHNRVRMITASFLVKDLHINWRWGEKYFAQTLIDYDPAVNNGNWQWVASTGCDAQPYFRIFNPWLQQKKFDPDCIYIKKWIPELLGVSPKMIHGWAKQKEKHPYYPLPCNEHEKNARIAKKNYSEVR